MPPVSGCTGTDGRHTAALSVLLFVAAALLSGRWGRSQWPLLCTALLLVGTQIALGVSTLRLGLSQPALTVAHQLVACLLVAVLAALTCRRQPPASDALIALPDSSALEACLASATTTAAAAPLTRDQVVPSRRRIKLPPGWRCQAEADPLLLATTLGGMALSEGWPCRRHDLPAPLAGALAAGGGCSQLFWEQELDGRMQRTSGALSLQDGSLRLPHRGCRVMHSRRGGPSGQRRNCLAAGLSLLGLCSYVLLHSDS